MNQSEKQLTAEEMSRARDKTQKKRDKKKQAGARAKQEEISARLGITSADDKKKQYFMPKDKADEEWVVTESFCDMSVKDLNPDWPWVGVPSKLLTQAPYALNEHNFDAGFFKLPQDVQTSPLFNIPRGMEQPILQILFRHHSCAGKFAATCQSAFNMIASNIDHWDFSRGGFNGCDEDPQSRTESPATVGRIVVVSQFRVRKWRGENYKCAMYSLQNLTHAFINFAERFEILHLHRIPLLTTHLLAMVVPFMTKLKVLGVYRCELLHIGDTMRLLEIIRTNRSYGNGKTHKVLLDFYPRFHVGPDHQAPGSYGAGSYGVTWDSFGLDSRLAIWQLLTRILPQARKQGVDLTGTDSAFKFWLEQSPCWRVDETIMAIEQDDDDIKLTALVDYPYTRGKTNRLSKNGDWAPRKYHCRMCEQDVLGIFYDSEELTQHHWFSGCTYTMLCLGCKLTMHLGYETDHRKAQKHHMVKGWLGDPNAAIKDGDLEKALSARSKRMGMELAARYDVDRKERQVSNPGPEVQKPRVKGCRYSPSIYEVEQHGFW